MYKVKIFKKKETFVDSYGRNHVIFVYGELTKTNHLNGTAIAKVKYVSGDKRIVEIVDEPTIINSTNSRSSLKEFNFGWAICDPRDTFDEEKGIELCKKRFARTPLSTQEGKFLTDDMIEAILANEIEYLKAEKLIPALGKVQQDECPQPQCTTDSTIKEKFKNGDILRLLHKEGKVFYGAYKEANYNDRKVTFYWLLSYAKNNSKFAAPCTYSIDEFISVDKAIREDIVEAESFIEKHFNRRWNWKEKKLEIKDTKKQSFFDLFW